MGEPDVRELWRHARALLDADEVDSREIRAAVLIMACAFCGPDLNRLRQVTGIPWTDINRVSYRLREAGIWGRGVFCAPWLEDEDPQWPIDFICQVLTATGRIVAGGPELFGPRTVGHEFGVDCDVPWGRIVDRRPLLRHGTEASEPEPFWVRRG